MAEIILDATVNSVASVSGNFDAFQTRYAENLSPNSNTFTITYNANNNISSVSNSASDPFGGNNAATLTISNSSNWAIVAGNSGYNVGAQVGEYSTYSVFIKWVTNDTGSFIIYAGSSTSSAGYQYYFSVNSNKTISFSSTAGPGTAYAQSYGNGWYRLVMTHIRPNIGNSQQYNNYSFYDGLVYSKNTMTTTTNSQFLLYGRQVNRGQTVAQPQFNSTGTQWTAPRADTRFTAAIFNDLKTITSAVNQISSTFDAIGLKQCQNLISNSALKSLSNWGYTTSGTYGLNVSINYGYDSVNKINYVDYRVWGTANTNCYPYLVTNSIPVSYGEPISGALWMSYTGTFDTGNRPYAQIQQANQNGYITNINGNFTAPNDVFQKYTKSGVVDRINTTTVSILIACYVPNGSTVDYTIRFGAPQLEKNSTLSAFVPTYGTAVNGALASPTTSRGNVSDLLPKLSNIVKYSNLKNSADSSWVIATSGYDLGVDYSVTDPDGKKGARRLFILGDGNPFRINRYSYINDNIPNSSSANHTNYAGQIWIRIADSGADISSGRIQINDINAVLFSAQPITQTWQKYTFTCNTIGQPYQFIDLEFDVVTNRSIHIYGAQLEFGTVNSPYVESGAQKLTGLSSNSRFL